MSAITFHLLGHTKQADGLIGRYQLKVTDSRTGKVATVSVEPRHLASARSMKRILLDRCMLYSATRAEHDQLLTGIFNPARITPQLVQPPYPSTRSEECLGSTGCSVRQSQ